MRPVGSFATIAILALAAVSASAQPIISAKSGVIAGVEGNVLLDNQELQQSVTHFPEMKEGSVVSTRDGRVEVMLPPGFMLRMGENGTLKMLTNRLVDTRVDLQSGSAVLEVDQAKPDFSVSVALKDGVVNLSKVGVYRFDSDPARLKVFHGLATVEIGGESILVGTGKMLPLAGGVASAEKFDVEQTDALDNWSRRRAEAMALANISGAKYSNDNYSGARSSGWTYNPYFDMYTYIPMVGSMCNPYYGMCFYSPAMAYQLFYVQPMMYGYSPRVGGSTLGSGTASRPGSALPTGPSAATSSIGSRSGSVGSVSSGPSGSGASTAAAAGAMGGHGAAGAGGRGK
jgi:hypothetical protein